MRYEESAGGIIIAREKKGVFVLLLKDPKGKWTFPKGLIEDDEDRIKCAKREIAEEVGLKRIKFLKELSHAKYRYTWEQELINKTVYYYLFESDRQQKLIPQQEEGIQDVKWFFFDKALEIIDYKKTNKKILEEAQEFIK